MSKQAPLTACHCLSPSRYLEHQPLMLLFKKSYSLKQQKYPQYGISKMFPGNGWLKGGQSLTQCPSSINHPWDHTPYQKHTKSTLYTPSALCWPHQFSFLKITSIFTHLALNYKEQLKRMFNTVSKYYKTHSQFMQLYTN